MAGTNVPVQKKAVKLLKSQDFCAKKTLLFPEGKGILIALMERNGAKSHRFGVKWRERHDRHL
jgi:hypothetical protein